MTVEANLECMELIMALLVLPTTEFLSKIFLIEYQELMKMENSEQMKKILTKDMDCTWDHCLWEELLFASTFMVWLSMPSISLLNTHV